MRKFPVQKLCARALFLLCALVLCLGIAGCKKDEEKGSGQEASVTEPAGRDDNSRTAEKPESQLKSYALSEPEKPASEEDQARAVRIVEYANQSDKAFATPCGQEPAHIMAGVLLYKQEFDAFYIKDRQGERCLRKQLAVPKDVFSEEDAKALSDSLEKMDEQRSAMRKEYDKLCAYIADPDIVDNGAKGNALTDQIGTHMKNYAGAVIAYRNVLEKASLDAQNVLLKGHPLKDHVLIALDIANLIHKEAEALSLSESDPERMDASLAQLEEKITTADRLPFPIAGTPEMHYRHFLKEAAKMAAMFRTGQKESFHKKVRTDLNAGWEECSRQYNQFVDAVNGL